MYQSGLHTEIQSKNGSHVCAPTYVSHSVVFDSATPWTVAHQAPLSMAFSRQEYWSGEPFPFPGDLPEPKDRTSVFCIASRLFID